MNLQQLLQSSHFEKPNVVFRYKPEMDFVIDPKTNQKSKKIRSIHKQSQAKIVSDIKVVNAFSPTSEIVQYESRASYSSMETSLVNEFKIWEQMCDVDKSIIVKVEKGFMDVDVQIQSLAAQFDVCYSLQQKSEEKLLQFQKLVKGNMFTKFSRSNCRNSMPRNVYYCSYWDAICWKPTNERYPKQSQTISISQILQVHTNVQSYQKVRKNFILPQWANKDCFLAIEAKKDIYLELLAPEPQMRNLYVKVINGLISNRGKGVGGADTNFLVTQYGTDVNNVRRILDNTRQFFVSNIERLKTSFLHTTKTMLNEEKVKARHVKSKTMMFMEKNQLSFEDLINENQSQSTQIKILEDEILFVQEHFHKLNSQQQNYNESKQQNHEMNEIYRLSQDILTLNGDCSINNESKVGSCQHPYQESLHNLERLKQHQQAFHDVELQLRQEIINLQGSFQFQIVQERQIQNQLQIERDDLLQANEELAIKLDEFSSIIEDKQTQFSQVVLGMREMQSTIQNLMKQNSDEIVDQQKAEVEKQEKQKQLFKIKLSQFKQQVVDADKESSKLFCQLLSFLSCLMLPSQLSLSPDAVIRQLCQVIPTLGAHSTLSLVDRSEQQRHLVELVRIIEGKVVYYLQNSEYQFLEQFRQGLRSLVNIRCQSPKRKISIQKNPVHMLRTDSTVITSPSNSSWGDNKENINNQTYF